MADTVIHGTGTIAAADYHALKWVGKTKAGQSVQIELDDAINMGNIEWTFAEKDDTVATAEFEACYDETKLAAGNIVEPFKVTLGSGATAGAGEIVLGVGKFYIDGTAVALTRGGGSFTIEREYREINADGDRGAVKDRVVIETSRAKLTLNALTFITSVTKLYPALTTGTVST